MARDIMGMPAPGVMATLNAPLARYFARMVGATDERMRVRIRALQESMPSKRLPPALPLSLIVWTMSVCLLFAIEIGRFDLIAIG